MAQCTSSSGHGRVVVTRRVGVKEGHLQKDKHSAINGMYAVRRKKVFPKAVGWDSHNSHAISREFPGRSSSTAAIMVSS